MKSDSSKPFVYMKVGFHAHESLDQILSRKAREFQKTGMIFWGYGGQTLHPTRVQQVGTTLLRTNQSFSFHMEAIVSNANPVLPDATEYSVNGREWIAMPNGIHVTGSKYALVLGEIRAADFELDLASYQVAAGPSEGRSASEYIKGRVDKGIFKHGIDQASEAEKRAKSISLTAELMHPFSVFIR